jgi:hypothetical protein
MDRYIDYEIMIGSQSMADSQPWGEAATPRLKRSS